MRGAGALHLDISPLGEIYGMGGVQGGHQVSQAGRSTGAVVGCLSRMEISQRLVAPSGVSGVFVKLVYHLLKKREGGRQGDINALPHRGFLGRSGL